MIKNILFVSHTLLMGGGANRSMIQLMVELRDNHGVNPIMLAPEGQLRPGDNGLVKECQKLGIPVERAIIPWFLHKNIWLHRAKYIAMWFSYPSLLRTLKKYDIDMVHSNGSVFDLGARISRTLGVPHVWHLREFGTEDETVKPVWGENYILKAYKKGDAFIAISDAIKKYYNGRISQDKIHRIYNGIDTSKYNKLSVHENPRVEFVMVGVVTPHKNQFEAVRAAACLVTKGLTNFHITIIGQESLDYANEIKKYVREHNLSEYVSFLGLRNDVPDLLQKMDIGLMLSKTEAFGRVTIEYMFQNLAVIGSDTGANPELIEDGRTGLLYHFGDEKELAQKMQALIENKQKLVSIAEEGRKFALDTFPSIKNSDAVFSLYKQLLSDR